MKSNFTFANRLWLSISSSFLTFLSAYSKVVTPSCLSHRPVCVLNNGDAKNASDKFSTSTSTVNRFIKNGQLFYGAQIFDVSCGGKNIHYTFSGNDLLGSKQVVDSAGSSPGYCLHFAYGHLAYKLPFRYSFYKTDVIERKDQLDWVSGQSKGYYHFEVEIIHHGLNFSTNEIALVEAEFVAGFNGMDQLKFKPAVFKSHSDVFCFLQKNTINGG